MRWPKCRATSRRCCTTRPLYERLAHELSKARDVLYLGRGVSYPLALEGALKLKEISYIHAEGYAAGELKHGPIALIDENVPVIVVAPADELFEKTVSNMQEVAARGGKIILRLGRRGRGGPVVRWRRISRCPPVHPLRQPAALCRAGAAPRLPHGRVHGHRRGPAAQSRQVGYCGIGPYQPGQPDLPNPCANGVTCGLGGAPRSTGRQPGKRKYDSATGAGWLWRHWPRQP